MARKKSGRAYSSTMDLDEMFAELGWEIPATMTTPCCGLEHAWGDHSHLTITACRFNRCTVWVCQCGAQDMSAGPVICPCDGSVPWGYTWPLQMRKSSELNRRRRARIKRR